MLTTTIPFVSVRRSLLLVCAIVFTGCSADNSADSDVADSGDAGADSAEDSTVDIVETDEEMLDCGAVGDARPESFLNSEEQIPYWRCCAEGRYGTGYRDGQGVVVADLARDENELCTVEFSFGFELFDPGLFRCEPQDVPLPFPSVFDSNFTGGGIVPDLGDLDGCQIVRAPFYSYIVPSDCGAVRADRSGESVSALLPESCKSSRAGTGGTLDEPLCFTEPENNGEVRTLLGCCVTSTVRFELAADSTTAYVLDAALVDDRCEVEVSYFRGSSEPERRVACEFGDNELNGVAAPSFGFVAADYDDFPAYEELEECEIVED